MEALLYCAVALCTTAATVTAIAAYLVWRMKNKNRWEIVWVFPAVIRIKTAGEAFEERYLYQILHREGEYKLKCGYWAKQKEPYQIALKALSDFQTKGYTTVRVTNGDRGYANTSEE